MDHPHTRAVLLGRNRTRSRAVVVAGFALGTVWAVVTPFAHSGTGVTSSTGLVALLFVMVLPTVGTYWNDGLLPAYGCAFGEIYTYFLIRIIAAPPPSGDVVVPPTFVVALLTVIVPVFAAGFGVVGFLLGAGTRRTLRRGRAWFDATDRPISTLLAVAWPLLVGRRYDRSAVFLGAGVLLAPVAGVTHTTLQRGATAGYGDSGSLLVGFLLTVVLVFGLPLAGTYWNDGLLTCWAVESVLVLGGFLSQRYSVSDPVALGLGTAAALSVPAFVVGAGGRRLVGRGRAWIAEAAAGDVPVGFEALVFGFDPRRSVTVVAFGVGLVATTMIDLQSGVLFLYGTASSGVGSWVFVALVVVAGTVALFGVGLVPTLVLTLGLVYPLRIASGRPFPLLSAAVLPDALFYATTLGSIGFLTGIVLRWRFRSDSRGPVVSN